jgi:ankyrin repeat protein
VIQFLVEAGADVDHANRQGHTPFAAAIVANRWDVAEYLVDRGARLSEAEIDRLFIELPREPERRALLRRATGN